MSTPEQRAELRRQVEDAGRGLAGDWEMDGDIPQHGRNCPAWKDPHGYECGDPCTCGLKWRIELVTERNMHAAWRKRAEEAEARISELESQLVTETERTEAWRVAAELESRKPEEGRWISVEERLPESGKVVLCQGFNYNDPTKGFWSDPVVAIFQKGKFHPEDNWTGEERVWSEDKLWANHWQSLPSPPAVSEAKEGSHE